MIGQIGETVRSKRFLIPSLAPSNVASQLHLTGTSIGLSTFPPCKRVLLQHMTRVNFQVCVCKRTHKHNPEIPSPLNHGFHIKTETGKLKPLRFEGDVIPKALVDVLAEEDLADELHRNMDDGEEEEEEEEEKEMNSIEIWMMMMMMIRRRRRRRRRRRGRN